MRAAPCPRPATGSRWSPATRTALRGVADSLPGESLVVPADLLDPAAIDAAFARVEEEWGPVEILVVNAGASMSAPLVRTTDEDWQRMLDLNLTAPFRCLRRALPAMTSAGFGRVVVIASVAGKVGSARIAAYTASKHGVLGLVRTAADGGRAHGRHRERRLPGYVDTPMTDESVANIAAGTGRSEDDARRILEDMQPIGRLVTVEEVASAVMLCVDNGADQRPGHQRRRRSGAVLMGDLNRINPDSLAKPSGFSHAVVARGTTVFLAGQTGMDASGAIVEGGVVAQFEQALANLLAALGAPAAPRRAGVADDLHRRHGRLPRPRPRDRCGLEATRRHRLPRHGRHRRLPALGRRGAGRDAGARRPLARRDPGPGFTV